MNVNILQEILINNYENIEKILIKLHYTHICDKGGYIAFPNHDGDNYGACNIFKNTLQYKNYTRNKSGNIYTLVMDECRCNFPEALEKIGRWIGVKNEEYKIQRPFGGFYLNVSKNIRDAEYCIKTYPPSALPPYDNFSKMWIDAGVKIGTQLKYGVRYDIDSNGIIIPVYNMNNDLIGAKWRNNCRDCELSDRWGMYIPYSKSLILYGLNLNYSDIVRNRKLIIFEAEKSVQLMSEYGCNLCVAIGGHNISNVQSNSIKSLFCDEVIVAFDKDVNEDEIKYEAKKIITDNKLFTNKVSYIYDNSNLLGEKDSPIDKGIEVFKKLYKERRAV